MRIIAWLFALASLLALPFQSRQILHAQTEQGTERRVPLRQCISQFYDPQMYNWLSLKNNCTDVVIDVVYCGQVKGGCSEMTLRPGRSSSTGYSRREVADMGEYAIYACPKDIYPYLMNGKQVRGGPEQPYQCGRPSLQKGSGAGSTIDFPGSSGGSSSSSSDNLPLVPSDKILQQDLKSKDNLGRLVDRVMWKGSDGRVYCVQTPWNTMGPQTKCVLQNGASPYPFMRVRFR